MLGYATIGTNDIDRARTYYDALFASIGAKRILEFNEPTQSYTMWGFDFEHPGLAVCTPYDGNPATPGNGNMAALVLDRRHKVDALHALALDLGGSDEGAPGLRGTDGPSGFYGAYFRDPDGNKLCAFSVGPADPA